MNDLKFTAKTTPALFFANGVLIAGTTAAILTGESVNITIGFLFLLVVSNASIIGVLRHRNRLETGRLARLIEWAFRNNERYGHATPTEAQGRSYITQVKNNPLVPGELADTVVGKVGYRRLTRDLPMRAEWYSRVMGKKFTERQIDRMPKVTRDAITKDWNQLLDNTGAEV